MTTQDDINNFNASNPTSDLLVLAAKTASETTNRIVSVATVNDLPDLSLDTVTPGTVFFVNSIKIPVVAQVGCWTGLDNRQLRSDCDVRDIWSWGGNNYGQLGQFNTTNRSSPVVIGGTTSTWSQVRAGFNHTLALKADSTAWAWGGNGSGRLGDNSTTDRSSPVSVVGGFTDWCQISAGNGHSVAVRTSGNAQGN